MNKYKFNINLYMYVKLTDFGKEKIIEKAGPEYFKYCIESCLQPDGYYQLQAHSGLPLHPLEYLEIYYKSDRDIEHLIKVAEEFTTDDVSKNICQQFRSKGYITYKQRRYLVYDLLHCYDDDGKCGFKVICIR